MNLRGEIIGLPELRDRLSIQRQQDAVWQGLQRAAIRLASIVKRDKLSGQVLNNVTGTLRRSINSKVQADSDTIINAFVGSFAGYLNPKGKAYAASYARINEYGGTFTIPSHTRRVGYDKYGDRARLLNKLHGIAHGVDNFSETTVKEHSATYPERSFLRSAVAENRDMVTGEIMRGLKRALAMGIL